MTKTNNKPPLYKSTLFYFSAVMTLLLMLVLFFELAFLEKIYPFISIDGVSVGGLTPSDTQTKVLAALEQRLGTPLNFRYKQDSYTLVVSDYEDLVELVNLSETISIAFEYGRSRFYPVSSQGIGQVALISPISLNNRLIARLEKMAQDIDEPAIDAQIKAEGGSITVTPSQTGALVDQAKLKEVLTTFLQTGAVPDQELPIKISYPQLTYAQGLEIKKTLDKLRESPLQLKALDQTYYLDLSTVLSMLDATGRTDVSSVNTEPNTLVHLNEAKLADFLSNIAQFINREVKEPLFSFDTTTKRVVEFSPPQEGKVLQLKNSVLLVNQALASGNLAPLQLDIQTIPTKNKLANELGIKELIGSGVSKFAGSIPNRIFNVVLTAKKINGVVVASGEEFSFDKTVGDITAATGFKQAYVIKSGRTVLDDGGGVCQVSTTVFRAALNSGVPITARTAHAYRVHYYEEDSPPGIDATIFYPTVDLKFKNDTQGAILIQAWTEGLTLYVNFYGTSDGRKTEVSTPIILKQTPPPPDLRQDDPTLPKGVVKQVDWSAWGANITFTRKVTRDGQELINEKFYSNYKPWQAVYLVGTKE